MWFVDWLKSRTAPRPEPEARVKILVISMLLEDSFFLERLAKEREWRLVFTNSPREAFTLASRAHFDLILCDRNQPGYPWREVVSRLADTSPGSCVLLVSPVKDDYLWSEALQNGGYDVLVRPLREKNVLHSVEAALRFISTADVVSR